MGEKDIQRLKELAENLLERSKTWTKEEALASLVSAGILDEDGNYTPPYQELMELEQQ